MHLYICGLVIILAGGFTSLLFGRRSITNLLGPFTAAAGGILCLLSAAISLAGGKGAAWDCLWPWSMPGGSLHFGMDGLSAFFALAISLISVLAAVYGRAYMANECGRRNLGASWLFYNVLVASMLIVVVAKNALFFLLAWELMSLASFLLVMFDDSRKEVISAGWTYLIAMHLGTAFLLAMFLLLGRGGSLEFADMKAAGNLAGVCFLLALIGFGTKAGLVPLHVWLPEAHPAAPSHVSAVMSGVMIKTGIYGLLRVLLIFGAPQAWWGYTLIAIGAVSGVLGVLWRWRSTISSVCWPITASRISESSCWDWAWGCWASH